MDNPKAHFDLELMIQRGIGICGYPSLDKLTHA